MQSRLGRVKNKSHFNLPPPTKVVSTSCGDSLLVLQASSTTLTFHHTASETVKIPLTHIDQLPKRMKGFVVLSLLDIASGYHQISRDPSFNSLLHFEHIKKIINRNLVLEDVRVCLLHKHSYRAR